MATLKQRFSKWALITRVWLNANPGVSVAFGFALLFFIYGWTSLPAPYNPAYLVKWIFKTPTYQCRDSTYSWAVVLDGSCSGHGGPVRRLKQ